MLVKQILQSKGGDGVFTVTADTLVSEAASILTEKSIGGLIVSNDGQKVVGILSERDIVRAIARRGSVCLDDKVKQLMTADPVCCSRQDSSETVLAKMTDGRFRHMPVVDDGVLSGIVTIGDVVKAQLQELSMEKNALQGMIMGH